MYKSHTYEIVEEKKRITRLIVKIAKLVVAEYEPQQALSDELLQALDSEEDIQRLIREARQRK